MINPDSPVPPYRQVADSLRGRIESGEWGPGGSLPSEAYLAHEYGVGRDTLRRSLRVLRSEAVIRSGGRGQRWQVSPKVERQELWMRPGTRVVFRVSTDADRRELRIPADEVIAVAEVYHKGTFRLVRGDEFELNF